MRQACKWTVLALTSGLAACAGESARFPLREPLRLDGDLAPVRVACRKHPTGHDAQHVSCAPESYKSPLYWDGADNLIFRPLSESLALETSGESLDVNALDELPDSAWFQNKLNARRMSVDEFRLGGCRPDQYLDPEHAADGTWVIDKGKDEGSTPGFTVKVPGKGHYVFKSDLRDQQPERAAAASVIGAAVYHAAGYYTPCEQVVYVRPSLFKLMPGLKSRPNFGDLVPLDAAELQRIWAQTAARGDELRMSASAYIPGHLIGPFRYRGTRADDPNDVIPHEDRREIRAARVLAAWIGRFDAREENSLDAWITDAAKGPDDASPGHVIHYQLDTSEALGSDWSWDQISRRLGHSYVIDWGDVGHDFVTLGAVVQPWETVQKTPGQELFGYFDVTHFEADRWKAQYPNPAFSRMTERDGAWMARILSRFTPEMVRALAEMGDLTVPEHTSYLATVLEGRLRNILERYLTKLSPIGEVGVERGEDLCGVDLAEARGVRAASAFRYRARTTEGVPLIVARGPTGRICVGLPRVALDGGAPDGAAARYLRIVIDDGVARGPLVAHLYDLGPTRGHRLVALERPEEAPPIEDDRRRASTMVVHAPSATR